MPRFVNWARTASCRPARITRPASEDELAEAIRGSAARGEQVKLFGAGHSWNDIACTGGHLVSLDRLSRVLQVDAARGEVEVEAGIRLARLNAELAARGLALPVLGSIAQQSVAGAIATGTHGSAPRKPNLSGLVKALRLVTARGEVMDLSPTQSPELFAAARVGLGALGAVARVTLQCEPAFRLALHAEPMGWDAALEAIPELVAREEFVKLWWLPHTDFVQVFRWARTDEPARFSRAARFLDEALVNRGLFAALLWLSRRAPGIIPPMNRLVRRLYFRPARGVARSDHALTIAMPARHDEIEIALPVELAAEALRRTRALIERERLRVNFVAELRFVAGDDAYLSPCYGRDSCYLGAYIAGTADAPRYFYHFERELLALGGRPHWGKQFSIGAPALAQLYPRWDDFLAARERLDPERVFRNRYLERSLAISSERER